MIAKRKKWAIAAAVIALAAGVLVSTRQRAPQGPQATQERLFGGAAAPSSIEVLSLTVEAKGETTQLAKEGKGWRIVSPLEAAADQASVEAILTQLQSARFQSVVKRNPSEEELKSLGLKPPKFVIRARATVDNVAKELVLYGGNENTFDGSVYLLREGEPNVYSASGGVRWSLEKTALELRDKALFAFDEPSVQRLSLRTPKQTLVLERQGAKHWKMSKPSEERADPRAVTGLLSSLSHERATAFLEKRDGFDFDHPLVDAEITFSVGDAVRIRLVRGEATRLVALRESGASSVLAEVPAQALTLLTKGADEFRDRSLLTFSKDEVAQLAFTPAGGGPALKIERVRSSQGGADTWRVLAPKQGPAKQFKLSSVLWLLEALKAGEPAPGSKVGAFGLGESARSVSLLNAQGKTLAKLVIGNPVPGKPGLVYARGSRPEVVEIESFRLAELPSRAEEVLE